MQPRIVEYLHIKKIICTVVINMSSFLKYCIGVLWVFVFLSCSKYGGEKNENSTTLAAEIERLEKERDSFIKIDFFTKEFKYLDREFNLNIDNYTFQKAIKKYKFYPKKIKTYKDSLNVVLTFELESYHGARIATNRITYEWQKIGYYIWENANKSKAIGLSFGYSHPYRFYEFLINEGENNSLKIDLLNTIKRKLVNELNDSIPTKPYKMFLKFAFKKNPKRIEEMNAYLKKHQHKH